MQRSRPGRQLITFLIASNLAMYVWDTFELKSYEMQVASTLQLHVAPYKLRYEIVAEYRDRAISGIWYVYQGLLSKCTQGELRYKRIPKNSRLSCSDLKNLVSGES